MKIQARLFTKPVLKPIKLLKNKMTRRPRLTIDTHNGVPVEATPFTPKMNVKAKSTAKSTVKVKIKNKTGAKSSKAAPKARARDTRKLNSKGRAIDWIKKDSLLQESLNKIGLSTDRINSMVDDLNNASWFTKAKVRIAPSQQQKLLKAIRKGNISTLSKLTSDLTKQVAKTEATVAWYKSVGKYAPFILAIALLSSSGTDDFV